MNVLTGSVEGNGGAAAAQLAERWAKEDALTDARLTWWVKVGQRCQVCREWLREETAQKHPGVCQAHLAKGIKPVSVPPEFKLAEVKAGPRLEVVPGANQEPPSGGEEDVMRKGTTGRAPCPECKSTSRHKSGCSKPPKGEASAEPSTRRRAEPRQAARRVREAAASDLSGLSLEELLAQRVQATETLEAVVEELKRRQEAIREALGSGL